MKIKLSELKKLIKEEILKEESNIIIYLTKNKSENLARYVAVKKILQKEFGNKVESTATMGGGYGTNMIGIRDTKDIEKIKKLLKDKPYFKDLDISIRNF